MTAQQPELYLRRLCIIPMQVKLRRSINTRTPSPFHRTTFSAVKRCKQIARSCYDSKARSRFRAMLSTETTQEADQLPARVRWLRMRVRIRDLLTTRKLCFVCWVSNVVTDEAAYQLQLIKDSMASKAAKVLLAWDAKRVLLCGVHLANYFHCHCTLIFYM